MFQRFHFDLCSQKITDRSPLRFASHRATDANQSAPGGGIVASTARPFLFLLIYALVHGVIASLGEDSLVLMRRRTRTGIHVEVHGSARVTARKLLSHLFPFVSSHVNFFGPSVFSRAESRADSTGGVLIARFGSIQSTRRRSPSRDEINRGPGILDGKEDAWIIAGIWRLVRAFCRFSIGIIRLNWLCNA